RLYRPPWWNSVQKSIRQPIHFALFSEGNRFAAGQVRCRPLEKFFRPVHGKRPEIVRCFQSPSRRGRLPRHKSQMNPATGLNKSGKWTGRKLYGIFHNTECHSLNDGVLRTVFRFAKPDGSAYAKSILKQSFFRCLADWTFLPPLFLKLYWDSSFVQKYYFWMKFYVI